MTLVEFLLARIADDERLALGALRQRFGDGQSQPHWLYDGNPSGAFVAAGTTVGQASSWDLDRNDDGGRFARHIVNWDPARVLAESDAKRQAVLVAFHRLDTSSGGDLLRLFALPYADHPDYQEGWKP